MCLTVATANVTQLVNTERNIAFSTLEQYSLLLGLTKKMLGSRPHAHLPRGPTSSLFSIDHNFMLSLFLVIHNLCHQYSYCRGLCEHVYSRNFFCLKLMSDVSLSPTLADPPQQLQNCKKKQNHIIAYFLTNHLKWENKDFFFWPYVLNLDIASFVCPTG